MVFIDPVEICQIKNVVYLILFYIRQVNARNISSFIGYIFISRIKIFRGFLFVNIVLLYRIIMSYYVILHIILYSYY